VGYTGGTTENPTYRRLGDHTESIQIDYDPSRVTYEKLLDVFWENHNATEGSWSKQYMPAVFFHNDDQRRAAVESKAREAVRAQDTIQTKLIPLETFYPAEDYHQKYWLQQKRALLKEFNRMYPEHGDFVDSTAAARVNGYLEGHGTYESLLAEIDTFGLSPEGRQRLLNIVKKR